MENLPKTTQTHPVRPGFTPILNSYHDSLPRLSEFSARGNKREKKSVSAKIRMIRISCLWRRGSHETADSTALLSRPGCLGTQSLTISTYSLSPCFLGEYTLILHTYSWHVNHMCNRMCTLLYLVGMYSQKSVQITVRGGHPSGLATFFSFPFFSFSTFFLVCFIHLSRFCLPLRLK